MDLIRLSSVFLLLTVNVTFVNAQVDVSIGKQYTIPSTVLNQEREIQIYLPDNYEDSGKKYPVLYILDGQWHFTNGVAIQKSLRVPDRLPEMIVVGIVNENPLRRTLFWQEREKFLSFLETEVISFISNNYRVTEERVLFGWEMGAYFAGYALLNQKQLFSAAIMTNGGYANKEMVDAFSSLSLSENKYLFLANSTKDIYTIDSGDSFAELLTENAPNQLTWKYELFNDEIHESLAYLALYHGLNYYYHNFQPLVFASIQEFENLGGISYLEEYSRKRGERYGLPTGIDNSIKNSLIWLAWNRNDFKSFSFFMTEFDEVLSTPRYASAYWQNRLAQFYLKHNDLDNAISYFNNGITLYPESSELAEMYNGLGQAYLSKQDKKHARKYLKKAVDIAEQNSDTELEEYKKQLSQI